MKDQKFSEGRSGSFFCFSADKNFIIKTIPKNEAMALKEILPAYYSHIEENSNSRLMRIYGFHSLDILSTLTIYVIVMGNFFNTKRKIHEKYDLKGSWVHRSVKEHKNNPSVLGKDSNLKRKLKLEESVKQKLLKQIENDVQFLLSQGIMDYSLLVGFHFVPNLEFEIVEVGEDVDFDTSTTSLQEEPKREYLGSSDSTPLEQHAIVSSDANEVYYVGIIDILQKYDLNKKMERFLKIYLTCADKDGLSVQPVDVYYNRFITKINSIFE